MNRHRCQSHCGKCGSHFTSDSAFDAHRGGSFRENTRCCWPEDSEGRTRILREDGICEIGDDVAHINVTVHALNPDFRSDVGGTGRIGAESDLDPDLAA